MNDKIWTIGRILKWTEQYFKDKGIESPRLDAEVLLASISTCTSTNRCSPVSSPLTAR